MPYQPLLPGRTLVDIIVPTRDRPEDLRRLIPTVLAQSHGNFRMTVVDQSIDPSPNQAAVAEVRDERIQHVVHTEKGKTKALNLALHLTSGEVIAFTDDDCTLPADWLARSIDSLNRNPSAGVIFGNLVAIQHDPDVTFVPAIEIPRHQLLRGPSLRSYGLIGMGANMIIRRAVFREIGLFDEDLGPGGVLLTGEECELTYRALRARIDVLRDPSLTVVHWGARPISGGVAQKLVVSGMFAVGAGYGKHIRARDPRVLAVVGHETAWVMALIAQNAVLNRRPLHLRRLGHFWKGVMAGFRKGPNAPAL
jgi:glycosyltransferase involved in cell wall biosynthesis